MAAARVRRAARLLHRAAGAPPTSLRPARRAIGGPWPAGCRSALRLPRECRCERSPSRGAAAAGRRRPRFAQSPRTAIPSRARAGRRAPARPPRPWMTEPARNSPPVSFAGSSEKLASAAGSTPSTRTGSADDAEVASALTVMRGAAASTYRATLGALTALRTARVVAESSRSSRAALRRKAAVSTEMCPPESRTPASIHCACVPSPTARKMISSATPNTIATAMSALRRRCRNTLRTARRSSMVACVIRALRAHRPAARAWRATPDRAPRGRRSRSSAVAAASGAPHDGSARNTGRTSAPDIVMLPTNRLRSSGETCHQ